MIKFRKLFSFSQKEITDTYARAKIIKKVLGLKLLVAPLDITSHGSTENHGKLLIVISRKTGKAHVRNLLRRRIKSIFFEQKLYQKPTRSVLIVYREATKLTFEQLQQIMQAWFAQSNA